MSGAIPLLPLYAFVVWTATNLQLFLKDQSTVKNIRFDRQIFISGTVCKYCLLIHNVTLPTLYVPKAVPMVRYLNTQTCDSVINVGNCKDTIVFDQMIPTVEQPMIMRCLRFILGLAVHYTRLT